MKKFPVKSLVLTAVFSALALLAFMIEGLFPPLFIPGARLGLSNLFVLLALICLGSKHAIAVLLIKVILGSLFAGNPMAILYALPSGVISLIIEIVLVNFCYKRFSLVAISALSAVISATVQTLVYLLVSNTPQILGYLPYLIGISVIAGGFVGICALLIIKVIPVQFFERQGENNG